MCGRSVTSDTDSNANTHGYSNSAPAWCKGSADCHPYTHSHSHADTHPGSEGSGPGYRDQLLGLGCGIRGCELDLSGFSGEPDQLDPRADRKQA